LDPAAGAEAGRQLTLGDVERLAADLGRTPRQRTTVYGDPPAERQAVLRETQRSGARPMGVEETGAHA
ncbi:MAG TPA: hypothetical protein VNP37_07745, partial [Actinomycetospora sp.]|nr:hypothetical protein [Actinomycetospora sp.]